MRLCHKCPARTDEAAPPSRCRRAPNCPQCNTPVPPGAVRVDTDFDALVNIVLGPHRRAGGPPPPLASGRQGWRAGAAVQEPPGADCTASLHAPGVAGHRGPSSVAQSATGALPATAWPSGGEPPARLPPRPRCPLPNGGLTGPQAPRCDPRGGIEPVPPAHFATLLAGASVPAAPLPAGAPVPAAPLLAGSSVPAAAPPAGSSVSAVAPFAGARVQIPVTHAGLSTHAAAPSAAPQEAGGAARLNGAAAQGSAPAPIPRPARAEPDPRPVSLQPSPDPGFWAGFKGVRQQSRGWSSRSKHNGEFRFLGSYDSPGEAAAAYDLFVVGTVLASRWRLNFPRLRALYIELTHPNQRSISTHLLTQQLPILVGALARNPLAAYILEATEPDGELLPGAYPIRPAAAPDEARVAGVGWGSGGRCGPRTRRAGAPPPPAPPPPLVPRHLTPEEHPAELAAAYAEAVPGGPGALRGEARRATVLVAPRPPERCRAVGVWGQADPGGGGGQALPQQALTCPPTATLADVQEVGQQEGAGLFTFCGGAICPAQDVPGVASTARRVALAVRPGAERHDTLVRWAAPRSPRLPSRTPWPPRSWPRPWRPGRGLAPDRRGSRSPASAGRETRPPIPAL
uniref:AP2/ERF domain-containing protein n=1 Tax=Auxenochlorella protothecoides TaxID=3075 RepID=A0A1D2A6S9_AUXPR